MNKMLPFEVDAILENIHYLDRGQWEMTRWNVFSSLAPWSKEGLEVTDVLSFPWDEKKEIDKPTEEQIEQLKIRAQRMTDLINGNVQKPN